nr:hypothetical protein [Tanacetum cinerariifolium]
MEMTDVQSTGLYYTWNQKPSGGHGILKKLDRIMANSEFQDRFVGAHAIFKPYRVSDHAPSILCILTMSKTKPKPFKFFNILTSHEKFLDVVKAEWDHYISGFHMYRVVKKLKNLKKPFQKLLYEKGDLHANVNRLRNDLDAIQTSLDTDPFNVALREKEANYIVEFNNAVLMEERFLKQKAKIKWLKEGDSNSAYFHKAIKSHVSRSRIDVITNSEGIFYENDMVPNAFVEHYELFLGQAGNVDYFNSNNLFKVRLNEQDALDMIRDIFDQEVKPLFFLWVMTKLRVRTGLLQRSLKKLGMLLLLKLLMRFVNFLEMVLYEMEAKESNDVLGVKIKKIDGKGMRTGILRTALRGMPLNQHGTFVTSTDGTIRHVVNQQLQPNNVTEKNASSSGIHSCSDEIFGSATLG